MSYIKLVFSFTVHYKSTQFHSIIISSNISCVFLLLATNWSQGIFLLETENVALRRQTTRERQLFESLSQKHSPEIIPSCEVKAGCFCVTAVIKVRCVHLESAEKHYVSCEIMWKNALIWMTMQHRRKSKRADILQSATFSFTELKVSSCAWKASCFELTPVVTANHSFFICFYCDSCDPLDIPFSVWLSHQCECETLGNFFNLDNRKMTETFG